MFSRTKHDINEERMDEIGEDLVRAARASDAEIEAAAGAPLLYSRIRVSIAVGKRESGAPGGGWLNILQAAKFAVPAMALVMVVVTCVPRLEPPAKMREPAESAVAVSQDAISTPYYSGDSSISQPQGRWPHILTFSAGTCALSNTQECAISNNEVLATLFADDSRETQR